MFWEKIKIKMGIESSEKNDRETIQTNFLRLGTKPIQTHAFSFFLIHYFIYSNHLRFNLATCLFL